VIVAVEVDAGRNALEVPAADLPREGRVPSVAKVDRYHLVLELLLVVDTPRPSVRKPRDDIAELGIAEDHVELHGEGRFLHGRAVLKVHPGAHERRRNHHELVRRVGFHVRVIPVVRLLMSRSVTARRIRRGRRQGRRPVG